MSLGEVPERDAAYKSTRDALRHMLKLLEEPAYFVVSWNIALNEAREKVLDELKDR